MALPDYLTDVTEEAIRERMLARVPADVDKSEGSFIWDSLAPSAFQLYEASIWAQEVLRRGFASTTFGAYLDLRCEERGVTRRSAVKAAGSVTFTGTAGTVIPAGTRVATPADAVTATPSVEFETRETVTLNELGEAIAEIEAVDPGVAGNVMPSSISLLTTGVPGVTGVINAAALTGGVEAESDEALLARYLVKVREPATSGNAVQYRQWALEVPGVGDAKVFPLWSGPGTVKLVIVDSDKQPAEPDLAAAVADYVDDVRPIGATVTVVSAAAKPISAAAAVVLAAGYTLQAVQDAFAAALKLLFEENAFAPYISFARIATLLLGVRGVVDHVNLTVNGGTSNVVLNPDEVAVIGSITLEV